MTVVSVSDVAKLDRLDNVNEMRNTVNIMSGSNQENKHKAPVKPDPMMKKKSPEKRLETGNKSKSPLRTGGAGPEQEVYKSVSRNQREQSRGQRKLSEREIQKRREEEEPWIPYQERLKRPITENKRESRSRSRRREEDDICEKCHHKKGRRVRSKSSDQILNTRRADSALPEYDRDREEMEILRRYIRREDPLSEYLCNCARTSADFHFNLETKNYKRSNGGQFQSKFDF